MIRECTVNCPMCGEPDTTHIEIEDYSTEYYITTECVNCAHPYVIGVTVTTKFRTGRVEMDNEK